MNELKFSIIVPVYNTGNYLPGCVDSVLGQSYYNWELLLIDDGSDQYTSNVCDRMRTRDSRIYVFHKKNEGQVLARQLGIQQATGEYVLFLDSDDALKKNAVETIAGYLSQQKADLLFFRFQRVKNGKIIGTSEIFMNPGVCLENKHEIYLNMQYPYLFPNVVTKVVKRCLLTKIDPSSYANIKIHEDFLYSLDMIKHANTCMSIADILYDYQIYDESISHTINDTYVRDSLESVLFEKEFFLGENILTDQEWMKFYANCHKYYLRVAYWILTSKQKFCDKKKLLDLMRKTEFATQLLKKEYAPFELRFRMMTWLYDRSGYKLMFMICLCNQLKNRLLTFLHASRYQEIENEESSLEEARA